MNFANASLLLGISSKRLFRWYRNVLSGYTTNVTQEKLHHHDTIDKAIIDKKTGMHKKVLVPILKEENFGENMTIDDKNISGEGYTIMANKDTGKIALMVQSTKTKILTEVLSHISVQARMKVKTVSKDLAEGYDLLSRTCFMQAQRVADKFHVIKLGLEALQAVRVRYRQLELAKERKLREECKKSGKSMKSIPKAKVFSNGETAKELLARSRYSLFKLKTKWTNTQVERMSILFKEFPEIKDAYDLICAFRGFYNCKIGDRVSAQKSLDGWYAKAGASDCYEVKNFLSSVRRHEPEILNYFNDGHTNAYAESLNNKIQNFVRSNYGIRDRDFFHFRLRLSLG